MPAKYLFVLLMVMSVNAFAGSVDLQQGMNKNNCESMEGKVVVCPVFIDSKSSLPWSDFDLRSTKDSLKKSLIWLQVQAAKNGKKLKFVSHFPKVNKKPTFNKKFPFDDFSKAKLGLKNSTNGKLDKWSDGVLKKVDKAVMSPAGPVTVSKEDKKITDRGIEKLSQKLKRIHGADQVVVLFFLNNYYKSSKGMTVNNLVEKVKGSEYGVISGKNPIVISKTVLKLFGAANFAGGPDKDYDVEKKMVPEGLEKSLMFSKEGDLNNLEIGDVSRYLLGWGNSLNDKTKSLLKAKPVK